MPLPRSLTQPLRQGQLVVGAGWRAYFAPFNLALAVNQTSSSLGPTIYDLEILGKFIDTSLNPTTQPGWFDLGYVKNFKFTPGSKTGNVMTGYRGAIRAKYRAETSEQFSWVFGEMGRTQMKIATGCQVFNLLSSSATASTVGPLNSSGNTAVSVGASGYQATGLGSGPTQGLPTLFVPAGSGAAFPAGTMIVADDDYNGTDFGFVGDAGANVFQGAVTDTDFIRKTSDYVATVQTVVLNAASGQDALILTAPFIGGGNQATLGVTPRTGPGTTAKVQKIIGYGAREGGTFITEWSAIFVLDTIDASQILFYYPRCAPATFAGLPATNLQNATAMQTYDQECTYDALAFDDPLDGETVVRYACYYPKSSGVTAQI